MTAPRFLAALAALCMLGGAAMALAADPAPAANPDAPARLVKMADGRLLAPDIARIVNRGEVVVAMLADDNPPFFSVRNGVLVGTDVDMAKRVAGELGVRVRFDRSPATFDGVAEAVAAGRADLGISRLARTLRRGQYVHFSNTYMRLGHALLINRVRFAALAGERPLQQVIRNFDGKLGVIAKSSWEEFGRRNFPNAQLVRFATWGEAVAAVRSGAVVAAYRDELEVQQIVRNDPGLALSLRTVTFDDLESPLAMMVGVGDPTLLSFVNEVIAQWVDKPTVSSILKAIK
jgi:ABC-type amino acid transport substrate-binding protein